MLYPEIEPYEQGLLPVGDGHMIYWEACGNPTGKAALVLHGGPGSGCTPGQRRYFDPEKYRIILFDQRGSGRSQPHAGETVTALAANDTWHLIADLELLRRHLGVEQWLVFGGSWGVTLALVYAETYPERVAALVLAGVTMTRRAEIDWLYHDVGRLFPAEFARFKAGIPAGAPDQPLDAAYYPLLIDPDPAIHEKAARDWCDWEIAVMSLEAAGPPSPRWLDPRFRLAFARIVTHYFSHNAWLDDEQILRDAHKLADIPGFLVHGRFDLVAPLTTAWELHQVWPLSELVTIEKAGHGAGDDGMTAALIAATDSFVRGAT